MYIDQLNDKLNKYNDIYYTAIEIKPVDVKPSLYIDFNKENHKEGPKFKVSDTVRISKCKNIFGNGYVANWS